MTSGAAPRKTESHPAATPIKAILYILRRHRDTLDPSMISELELLAVNAYDFITQRDPVVDRIGIIVLGVRQCWELRGKPRSGRQPVYFLRPEMATLWHGICELAHQLIPEDLQA